MAQSQIPRNATLDDLLGENSFSLGKFYSHALAAVFIPLFEEFQSKWFVTSAARTTLVIAVSKAEGAVAGADDDLDDFLDLLDRTLLIVTKNDRQAQVYLLYFGKLPVYMLKRPVLGEELETLRSFLLSLQTSAQPALAALAPPLAALIVNADAAVAQHQAATQALKDFDMIGAMKTLIDGYNALRQTVYGKLAAIPHEHPEAMLPASFADRFFRHETNKGITALRNPKDVRAKIDGWMKKVEAGEKHFDSLTTAAAQKVIDKQAALDAVAALEAGQKVKAEADANVKRLKKEAEAAKKKKKK